MIARSRRALLVLAAIALIVVVGCRRGGGNAPDHGAVANGLSALSPPDAAEIELAFPPGAEWVNEPLTITHMRFDEVIRREQSSIRLFRGTRQTPEGQEDYLLKVDDVTIDKSHGLESDGRNAAFDLAAKVHNGKLDKDTGEPVTCNGYPGTQYVARVAESNLTYVIRGVAVGDRTYVLFVRGPAVRADSPQVKQFFDSFRHKTIPPPPGNYTPPQGEGFRPLASLPLSSWAVFSTKDQALYTTISAKELGTLPKGEGSRAAPAVVARYDYPSFRRTALYPIAKDSGSALLNKGTVLLDDVNGRLFLLGNIHKQYSEYDFQILRYDFAKWKAVNLADLKGIPPLKSHANEPVVASEPVPVWPHLQSSGLEGKACVLAGGGRYVIVLSGNFSTSVNPSDVRMYPGDAKLSRYDAETLKIDRTMNIPQVTGGLAVAPDSRTVYVVANRQQDSSEVWEIHTAEWEVRRKLTTKTPGRFHHIACSSRNTLFLTMSRYWGGSTLFVSSHTRILNLNHSPPVEYLLPSGSDWIPLVTDGRRLITTIGAYNGSGSFHLWDVEGAVATWRPRTLGSVTASVKSFRGTWSLPPVLSPDGKCLLVESELGKCHAYWLASGPLPEVDPAAAWKP